MPAFDVCSTVDGSTFRTWLNAVFYDIDSGAVASTHYYDQETGETHSTVCVPDARVVREQGEPVDWRINDHPLPPNCTADRAVPCGCPGGEVGTRLCEAGEGWRWSDCGCPGTCAPGDLMVCDCAAESGRAQAKRACREDGTWGACECPLEPGCVPRRDGANRDCMCDDGRLGLTGCTEQGWLPCDCEVWQ